MAGYDAPSFDNEDDWAAYYGAPGTGTPSSDRDLGDVFTDFLGDVLGSAKDIAAGLFKGKAGKDAADKIGSDVKGAGNKISGSVVTGLLIAAVVIGAAIYIARRK